jgi:hypothetical protein
LDSQGSDNSSNNNDSQVVVSIGDPDAEIAAAERELRMLTMIDNQLSKSVPGKPVQARVVENDAGTED